MTREDVRTAVIESLRRIAPEIDPTRVEPAANLREELDLDSMDFLRFILMLHERLAIDVPEVDYARLSTLDGAVAYAAERLGLPRT